MKMKEKVFTNNCNKPKWKNNELVPCKDPKKRSQPASKAAAAAIARAAASSSNNVSSGQLMIVNSSELVKTDYPRQRKPFPAGAEALNRQSEGGTRPYKPCLVPVNPNAGMSEDQALEADLATSLAGSSLQSSNVVPERNLTSEEEKDRIFALALQESEKLARLIELEESQATRADRILAQALQESEKLAKQQGSSQFTDGDMMFAQALQESEMLDMQQGMSQATGGDMMLAQELQKNERLAAQQELLAQALQENERLAVQQEQSNDTEEEKDDQ